MNENKMKKREKEKKATIIVHIKVFFKKAFLDTFLYLPGLKIDNELQTAYNCVLGFKIYRSICM